MDIQVELDSLKDRLLETVKTISDTLEAMSAHNEEEYRDLIQRYVNEINDIRTALFEKIDLLPEAASSAVKHDFISILEERVDIVS